MNMETDWRGYSYQPMGVKDCRKPSRVRREAWNRHLLRISSRGVPGWLRGLAPAFGPGLDPGAPGSSPRRAPGMEPAAPSAGVSASLPLYVYHK